MDVEKSDNKDITRPGHELTYVITVKNKGNVDIDDLRITDTVPAKLTVISINNNGSISGQNLAWSNIHLGAGETLEVAYKAIVKDDAANNLLLVNKVKAVSPDHDLTDEASDTTRVERQGRIAAVTNAPAVPGKKSQVKVGADGTPIPVPISAKTGAEGAAALIGSLTGLVGLFSTVRKFF